VKVITLSLAVFAGLAVSAAADDDAAKIDTDKLQGVWKTISVESDGKKMPEDGVKDIRLTVKGDRMIFKAENKEEEATFKLDVTQKPRALDWTIKIGDKVETVKLIYDLRGDDLKICGGKVGKDRPKEFAAKAGSGLNLIVLKREKE
jgi:uncharacterized protein (TIGR03067 family)